MHKTRRRKMTVDVDEGKKAEEQSRFLAQLRATLNVIPGYTWYAAPSGGITFVNKRTADYLDLPKDHPLRFGIDIGAQWDAHIPLLHPDDHEKSRKSWSTCLRTGEFAEENFRVRDAQGGYRWFRSRVEPLRASDGTLLQWVGLNVDIEELKRAEDALRESEYKLRQIIETVPGLIWSTAPDGEPIQLNQRTVDYSGMQFEDYLHGGWEALVHPDDFPETASAFYHAIQTGTSYQTVHRLRRADGEFRWYHVRGEPLRDRQGRIIQWYGLFVDIDEAKKAEDRLRLSESYLAEARLELAHANRVATMGQLTASITHEVNQPITAAVTYALAARRWLSAEPPNFHEVDDALSLIVKEGNRAGEVVERIRALIKKVPARKDAVAIDDAILEVIALTRTEAANNRVSVRTQFAEGLPRVQGDRVQLQQVMLNLIVNAIQAMSGIGEGAHELQISIDAVPSEGGVRVGVRDTGHGLRPESLPRLFEPFYTTKPDGMGMGLSICRSIIEAHGGRLWATRCEPRGALFQFT